MLDLNEAKRLASELKDELERLEREAVEAGEPSDMVYNFTFAVKRVDNILDNDLGAIERAGRGH